MLQYSQTYFRQRVSAMAQARKNYSSDSRSGSALGIGLLWAVVARGNAGADMIYPGSGSDTVLGNSQADTVINDDTQ